jgi:hypothetical protein
MKYFGVVLFVASVAFACSSSGASGSDICSRYSAICPSGASGDGGVTITIKCDAAKIDTASNKDEIKSCLDSAKDCSGGQTCLLKAKQ